MSERSIDISRARVQRLINMDAVPSYLVGALLDEIDKLRSENAVLRTEMAHYEGQDDEEALRRG